MNTITSMAQKAYGQGSSAAHTPRDIEFHALAYVTSLMDEARASGVFPKIAEAMFQNVRLWSAFGADVVSEGNTLPDPLRARIAWLADFARFHMAKVLDKQATVDPLIEINTMIMKGLRGETGEESEVA